MKLIYTYLDATKEKQFKNSPEFFENEINKIIKKNFIKEKDIINITFEYLDSNGQYNIKNKYLCLIYLRELT